MTTPLTVTVLGATGGAGNAITRELVARGHTVTAVSRAGDASGPLGLRRLAADLLDHDQAVTACAGADVVVMAAHVPYPAWATTLPTMFEHAIAGASAAGARLVVVDNLYAYGAPDGPISERTPEAATTRKGRIRHELVATVLAAHRAGRVRATIGRFSDYYGPRGTNSALYQLGIAPLLAGKRPRALIDGDQPRTFAYLPDVARAFATLVERPEADGRAWILPAAPPATQRDLIGLVAEAVGGPAPERIGRITPAMLALAGLVNPELRELRELVGQWDRPYVTDASAFEAAFGPFAVTPHRVAIAATVAAFRGDAGTADAAPAGTSAGVGA